MPSLLIDTSTERGITAILDQSRLVFSEELPFGYNNSKHLVPQIMRAFKQTGLSAQLLDYIAVGIGPGSYTGIRVGVIVAKSLAYAAGLPLVGVCSLMGFVPSGDGAFAAIMDAKMGGAYILVGNKGRDGVCYTSQPEVCALEKLGQKLEGVSALATPHSAVLQPKLQALYPGNSWKWEEKAPDPIHMGRIAQDKYEQKEYSLDGHLELLYLRKTQAETERQRHRDREIQRGPA